MDLNWLIGIISGAVGGVGAGKVLKGFSLGTLWNAVAGLVGGGIGAKLVAMLPFLSSLISSTGSAGGIVGNIASGGVGGGVMLAIVGFVRKMMAGK